MISLRDEVEPEATAPQAGLLFFSLLACSCLIFSTLAFSCLLFDSIRSSSKFFCIGVEVTEEAPQKFSGQAALIPKSGNGSKGFEIGKDEDWLRCCVLACVLVSVLVSMGDD